MSEFNVTQDGTEFDWRRHREDIAVPEQLAIAVYRNPAGDVVIRQGSWPEPDDACIILSPRNARQLATAILRTAGDIEALGRLLGSPSGGASEGHQPKDPTAAERQRRYRQRNGRNARNGNGADRDDNEPNARDGSPALVLLPAAKGAAE